MMLFRCYNAFKSAFRMCVALKKVDVSLEHSLSVSKSVGGGRYYLSGCYNVLDGYSPSSYKYSGLRANFETTANKYISFGLNSSISTGDILSTTGASWTGYHDDDTKDKRALSTALIKIKFTSYGSARNGAVSIITSDLLRYRVNSTLPFTRYFSNHHQNCHGYTPVSEIASSRRYAFHMSGAQLCFSLFTKILWRCVMLREYSQMIKNCISQYLEYEKNNRKICIVLSAGGGGACSGRRGGSLRVSA